MEEIFEKTTSLGKPVKYIRFNYSGEHQSMLQRVWKKKYYVGINDTAHTPSEKNHREKIYRY